MKSKRIKLTLAIFSLIFTFCCLCGCFESVVPCAWVSLDMEGYAYYSANAYGGDHICLYKTEEDAAADKYRAAYLISIGFFPRIMGADMVGEKRTTTVDISKSYSMMVYINKTTDIYDPQKSVYLNGKKLTPSNTHELDTLLSLTFENFEFVRGNPGGKLNGYVNLIEYKI